MEQVVPRGAPHRRDLCDAQTLGDGDHGHISRVEPSILVEPDEFGHPPHIHRKQINQLELFGYEIKKLGVYGRPHMPIDRPTGFDQDRRRKKQRPLQFLKKPYTAAFLSGGGDPC